MTSEQTNPSSKTRFQEVDKHLKEHHDLIQMPAFQRAQDMALLLYSRQMASEVSKSANPQLDAHKNGLKLAGAHEFMNEFLNLAETAPKASPPGLARTLDHSN